MHPRRSLIVHIETASLREVCGDLYIPLEVAAGRVEAVA
jgi:hypothetical protein